MEFEISVGSKVTDNFPVRTKTNLHDLYRDLLEFKKLCEGKDGPYICAASLKNDGRRIKDNVAHADIIILDVEKTPLTLEALKEKIPYESLWYSTYSYGVAANGSSLRLRIIIPCTRPVKREEYSAIVKTLNNDVGGAIDPTSDQPERLMFLPRRDAPDSELPGFVTYHRGVAFNPDNLKFRFLSELPDVFEDDATKHERFVRSALEKMRSAPAGERNSTYYGQAKWLGQLSHSTYVSIEQALEAALTSTEDASKTEETVRRAWEAGARLGPVPYEFSNASEADIAQALAYTLGHPNKRLVFCEDCFWQYNPEKSVWGQVTDTRLKQYIMSWNGRPYGEDSRLNISNAKANGAISLLQAVEGVSDDAFFLDAPLGISFKNSFITIDQETFDLVEELQHPKQRQRACVQKNIHLHRPYRGVRWRRFLREIFEGDDDAQQKIEFLAEFVGACLMGIAPRYEKAVILEGVGSNGKSVFLKVISELFPEGSICTIPLERFSEPSYIAALVGKRANIVSEIEAGELYRSSGIKGVISQDPVTGRRLYGQPFTFRPEAGHIFSVNGLPEVRDSSHGFFRRWEIIEFNRVFNSEEQEYGLDKKLIKSELKEVYTWALLGAKRLVQNGRYTEVESSKLVVQDWKESTNSVELFVSEMITDDEEKCVRADAIYRSYRAWAEQNGFGVLNASKFGRRLTELLGKDRKTKGSYVMYSVGLRNMPGELTSIGGGNKYAK